MIFRLRSKFHQRRFFDNLDTLIAVFSEEAAILDLLKTFHAGQKEIIDNIYERTQHARLIAHDLNNGNTRRTTNEDIMELGKELSNSAAYITRLVTESNKIKDKAFSDNRERQKYSQ